MEFARVRQVQDAIDVIVAHTLFTDILTAQPLQLGVVTDVCGFAGNGAHFDADAYSTSMAMTKSYRANGNFFSRTWCFERSAIGRPEDPEGRECQNCARCSGLLRRTTRSKDWRFSTSPAVPINENAVMSLVARDFREPVQFPEGGMVVGMPKDF